MIVRHAHPADAEQLAQLNRVFNDSNVSARQLREYLSTSPEHEITAVVEVDGELVGFACLQIYRSWCYPESWAELTEMYVKSEYRRRGHARALLSFLENEARAAGATEIVLLTSEQNAAGQALYRSCDYREQGKISFRKVLDAPIVMVKSTQHPDENI